MRPLQATLAAVHSPFTQQAWLLPPQLPQLPLAQVPPRTGQVVPALVHWPPTQHPPLAQALSAQHGWPAPPHCAHKPCEQTLPPPQVRPGQHACPAPPQLWHMLATQVPLEQVPLEQQAWPTTQLPAAPVFLPHPATSANSIQSEQRQRDSERIVQPPRN
jgi:hypothetical protein